MSFATLGLSPVLLKLLTDQFFTLATPIQTAAIPAILNKKDVLGIAKTGSGKTAAYVLPLLMNFYKNVNVKNRHVNVLVLVPTRELAVQVKNVFNNFTQVLPQRVKTLAVFGGASINPQMMALQGVNVLVATPGRLLELVTANAVHLSEIDTLVMDEADKLLTLGFKGELDRIMDLLPPKRQNILFSATLSPDLQSIQAGILQNPEVIKIESEEETIDQIKQIAYLVAPEKKGPYLRQLIVQQGMKQVLVFASSIHQVDTVVSKLIKNKIMARAMHSQKSQGARTEALTQFKAGKLPVLVATDLMARGIDIDHLPYVINYELPRSSKDYIHRIGRTGRAGASGEAISLLTHNDLPHFEVIQKKMGKTVEIIDIER
ncbi:DEAD/DEAH box helicase [Sphingobacterium bovisgrunnientis]|uniref:DEAD/DEAH box helicase n=1 Tax=Sphingobacterium bovisgrunnientis TaxID=1874697 RepID=UPI001356C047|nr:DEAD/DEAH box helicase [Sphingobacterium bovisgrunnientis]